MKKILLVAVLLLVVFSVYAEEGDLVELMQVLGHIKAFVIRLESGKEASYVIQHLIDGVAKDIQKIKKLLDQYDYPNEKAIKKQVDEYEQRYVAIVMSL